MTGTNQFEALRSVDTAPKDGSYFLFVGENFDGGMAVVHWSGDLEWWMLDDGKNFEIPLRGEGGLTGWMPLPALASPQPEAIQGDGDHIPDAGKMVEPSEEAADLLTGCTLSELLDRLPPAERLEKVAADLERLERICDQSKRCSTPEGPAVKAVVYGFMLSAIADASFAALALRQLLPSLRFAQQSAPVDGQLAVRLHTFLATLTAADFANPDIGEAYAAEAGELVQALAQQSATPAQPVTREVDEALNRALASSSELVELLPSGDPDATDCDGPAGGGGFTHPALSPTPTPATDNAVLVEALQMLEGHIENQCPGMALILVRAILASIGEQA